MSMSRRNLLRAGAGAALGALARPALAQPVPVLRFVPHASLTVLDPVWSSAYVTRNHGYLVFDTLYGYGRDLTPKPQMAQGHEISADGRVWTITLREGLTFHDGERVLGRDCVASLKRWSKRDGFGQTLAAASEDIVTVDDRRFAIRLKRPFPLVADALARVGGAFIMPERLADTDAFTQLREVVGSGPYRFRPEAFNPGEGTAYERFDRYVPRDEPADMLSGGKRAHLSRIEWKVMPDPSTAAAALQSGEIDWIEAPSADLLPLLRRQRQIRLAQLDPFGQLAVLRVNHAQAPFGNAALRRALWPAISQADAMQVAAGTDRDRWRDGVGFFAPATPMSSDVGLDALTSARNVEAARRAVAASGYAGERVVLLAPTDNVALDAISHVVGDVFKKVGLNLDYAATDWGTVVQRRTNRGPVAQGGWSALCTGVAAIDCATPSAHSFLRGLGASGQFGWPDIPEIEEVRNRWLEAASEDERKRLAADMQRVAFREVPYYPLGQYWQPGAHLTSLTDIVASPVPVFWNLRKQGA